MKYKHYLLTRYNLGLYKAPQKTRHNKAINPDKWIKERTELFAKYCVPSVVNQTCKNFKWIIAIDTNTPMTHLMQIREVIKDKVYGKVDYEAVVGTNFRQAVKDVIGIPGDILITSRMDNDDMIHKNYIKDIQLWYKYKQKTGVLIYPTGWIYNPVKKKLFHCRYMKNPFISLVEKADKKVRTILFHRHTEAVNYYKLHKIENKEHMWCQIIHKSNLANYCWGDRIDVKKFNKEDYGL